MNIIIYSTPTCPFCKKAKDFFSEHNVEYTEIDVSANEQKAEEMIQKSGQMAVPVIDVDGEIIVGFDEGRLREILKLG